MLHVHALDGPDPLGDANVSGSENGAVVNHLRSLSQITGEIAELEGYGRDPEELRDYTDGVESVTLGTLEEASRRYLDTAQSILVVVGDKIKVAEGLLSLELGPVVRLDPDGDPL